MAVTKHKSPAVPDPRDARARRTRARLDEAFVALLQRRAYDGIRVSDLTRKSGVGRATFYAHYPSKEALLRSQLDRIVAPMLVRPAGSTHLDASRLFAHVSGHPRIYGSLMVGTGRRAAEECLEARVTALLVVRPSVGSGVPLAARVLASSLLGLASWSIDHPEVTCATLQASFRAISDVAVTV